MQVAENEFKHESYQDCETIVDYLKSIIEGIENGSISLGTEKTRIDLVPQGLLKLKIEAKRKSNSSKLNLQVSWKDKIKAKSSTVENLKII
ncbi:MAG: amphi-Trp domain-containing protein [bacterium]|nr:amphi-Trp domain-containing protein [bacterium]